MCLQIFGSRCYSAKVIPYIRSAEITRVVTFVLNWKHVQDACSGNGNVSLNKVSKASSEQQCHSGMLPNERKVISVRAFLVPGMCTGVNGQACVRFTRNASARTSCAATRDFTVGELLLNKATCLCAMSGATPSRQSCNRSNPAISSLELYCGGLFFVESGGSL